MAITYPLPSPTSYGIATVVWGPMTNTQRLKKPFTFQDIVQVYDGEMWQGAVTVTPQNEANGRGLSAWVTSLQGMRGKFYLEEPGIVAPLGTAKDTPGTPVIAGGGQSGSTVDIDGLPFSATGYLLPGDNIAITVSSIPYLHKVLEQVDSNGSGEATVSIWPSLRGSPSDNSSITLSTPQGVFALTQPHNPWTWRPGKIFDSLVLQVAEVVP